MTSIFFRSNDADGNITNTGLEMTFILTFKKKTKDYTIVVYLFSLYLYANNSLRSEFHLINSFLFFRFIFVNVLVFVDHSKNKRNENKLQALEMWGGVGEGWQK